MVTAWGGMRCLEMQMASEFEKASWREYLAY
jgi:hypothetical protein